MGKRLHLWLLIVAKTKIKAQRIDQSEGQTVPIVLLDEDISFESFEYEDAEPSPLQRFFLAHKEINVAEFARMIGMNPTLLRNYINGFKKPSKEREQEIIEHIHKLGEEMIAA